MVEPTHTADKPPFDPSAEARSTEVRSQVSATTTITQQPDALPAIPGFEVTGMLGRGGMGAVYRARQLSLNREVAVKMILTSSSGGTELSRFRREAEGIARLRHPNIVQIYEVGEANGQPFLVLELVEGGSLKDRLGDTPLPATEAATLLATLARAVHAAHLAGVIHRDLKPANILMATAEWGMRHAESKPTSHAGGSSPPPHSSSQSPSTAFQPKVTDFGLAKFLGDESGQTRTGDILGTPGYMAPEQASGRGSQIGPGTDIWALGVILYEALTGARPFRARDIDVLLAMIRTEDPIPPGRVVPGIPRDLETICLMCLRKEPGKRYADAAELADDLERFLVGRPIHARPVGTIERAWKWVRRNKVLTAFVFTILASLTAAAAGLALHNDRLAEQLGKTAAAEQQASREAEEKGKALDDKTRAEQQAIQEANDKTKALQESLRRQIDLHAGTAQRAIADGDTFTAIGETLQVLKVVDGNDADRTARERVRLGMLLRRSPKLVLARTSEKAVHAAAFSPDGKLIATVGDDGYLRLFDTATGEPFGEPLLHHAGFVPLMGVPGYDLLFTPDGQKIITAAGLSGVFITDVATRKRSGVLVAQFDEHTKDLLNRLKKSDNPIASEIERMYQEPGGSLSWPKRIQLSQDGKRLLATDPTGRVQVWDMVTRKPLTPVLRHVSFMEKGEPVLSPDGLRLATMQRSELTGPSSMQLLLIDPLRPIGPGRTFDGEMDYMNKQLAFTPDSRTLVMVSEHGTRAWSVADGSERPQAAGPRASFLAFSPDGRFDVRVGHLGIRVRHVATGREEFAILGSVERAAPPVFSPDGQLVAVASFGGLVRICDRHSSGTGSSVVTLPHAQEVTRVVFAPDGRRVMTVCMDRTVRVWDLTGTDAAPQRIPGDGLAAMIAYSPDGRYMATAFGTVQIYDARTLEQAAQAKYGRLQLLTAEFSHDSKRLLGITTMLGRALPVPNPGPHLGWVVWDVERNKPVGSPLLYSAAADLSNVLLATISPDGRRVAWGVSKDAVQITDVESGKPTLAEPIPLPGGGKIDGLAFNNDGTRLAVKAGTIRVFDATTGKPTGPELKLPGTGGRVTFSPDGRRVAACSIAHGAVPALGIWARTSDAARSEGTEHRENGVGIAQVWDTQTGKPLTPVLGLADQPSSMALRPPRGDQLLVSSFDGTVRAWNIDSEQAAFRDLHHLSMIMHANYSPDGHWIGYTDLLGTTYLREAATGALLVPPITHSVQGKGTWLAFRPDGRQVGLATGTDTLFWDLSPETRPIAMIEQAIDTLTGVAADPTGRALRIAAPDLFRPEASAILTWHRDRLAEIRNNGEPIACALPHLDRLLTSTPNDATMRIERAACHVARRNWVAALADLDAAASAGITAQSQLLRGRVHYEQGEVRKALEAFDEAVELSSSLKEARLHRGKAKLALRDWAGGAKDITDAMERGSIPITDDCCLALAQLLTGRTEPRPYDAICKAADLEGGATTDPDQAAVMAMTFAAGPADTLQPDVAVGLATRAAQFDPDRADYRFALGLALFRAGKTADAMTHLRLAEKTGDATTRLKARLALSLAAPENDAKQWLEKARTDIKAAEAELAVGRSLLGTAWEEVEVLRRQAEARFK